MVGFSISFVRYGDTPDDKVDIALTKLKMPYDTHWQPTIDFNVRKTLSAFRN
jgi:hypothetical protein